MRSSFVLACLFASVAQAQAPAPMTQEDAFAAANSAGGTAAAQAAFNNINAGTGAAKIEGYSGTAAESSYWGVGTPIAPILTAGASKITNCSGTPSSDPRIAQQCEAILAIQHQPSIRPPGLITANDPLILTGDAITNDPEAIAGSMTAAYTGCTTTTTSLGKDKTTETCDEYSSLGTTNCSIGAEVTVDADHLFKCIDSQHVVGNATCTIGRVVVVDADANYQCVSIDKIHQNQTCTKTNAVTVQKPVKGMPPDTTYFSKITPAQPYTSTPLGIIFLYGFSAPFYGGAMPIMPAGSKVFVKGVYVGTSNGGDLNFFIKSYANTSGGPSNGPYPIIPNRWNLVVGAQSFGIVLPGDLVEVKTISACPTNFTTQADKTCLSNDYQTYASNSSCTLFGSSVGSYPGLSAVTEYHFACKMLNDQCAGLAARAQ